MKYEHIYDQGLGKLNEDAWLAQGNIFAVFDGATGVSKYENEEGKTGGYLAANIARETLMQEEGSLKNGFIHANINIKKAIEDSSMDSSMKSDLWVTSAAAVKISGNKMEWAQIGDCLILLINQDGSNRLLVDDYDHDRETLSLLQSLLMQKVENPRERLFDQMTKASETINVTHGALNGEEAAASFINSGIEDLSDVKNILLFTDGLFLPKENPAEKDDFNTFVQIFKEKGLMGIQTYVRTREEADKQIVTYPRFKIHDDIAAIAITV